MVSGCPHSVATEAAVKGEERLHFCLLWSSKEDNSSNGGCTYIGIIYTVYNYRFWMSASPFSG